MLGSRMPGARQEKVDILLYLMFLGSCTLWVHNRVHEWAEQGLGGYQSLMKYGSVSTMSTEKRDPETIFPKKASHELSFRERAVVSCPFLFYLFPDQISTIQSSSSCPGEGCTPRSLSLRTGGGQRSSLK